MFSNKPNYVKLRTNLRLCINRLKLLEKKKSEIFLFIKLLQWNICIYLFYIYLCILYYCNNTTIRTIELGAFFSIDDSAKLTVTSSALLWMDKSLKWASLVTLQSQKALVTEVAILWLWQEYDWNHLSKQFWFYWDLKGSTSQSLWNYLIWDSIFQRRWHWRHVAKLLIT